MDDEKRVEFATRRLLMGTDGWYHSSSTGRRSEVSISLLVNSVHYFLDCVCIVDDLTASGGTMDDHGDHGKLCDDPVGGRPGRYRLVVLRGKEVLTDDCYDTLKGAKIAFSRIYRDKALRPDVKAMWSHEYLPNRDWMQDKLRLLSPLPKSPVRLCPPGVKAAGIKRAPEECSI